MRFAVLAVALPLPVLASSLACISASERPAPAPAPVDPAIADLPTGLLGVGDEVEVQVEALPPLELDLELLPLEPAFAERMRTHAAREIATDQDVCDALEDAISIAGGLGPVLEARRAELFLDDELFVKLVDQTDSLSASLPGLYIRQGAEYVYSSVDTIDLAARSPSGRGKDALTSAAAVLGAQFPVWIDQTWDGGGCTKLGPAVAPLTELSDGWADAPRCIRDAVGPLLTEKFATLGEHPCFCRDRDTVGAAVLNVRLPLAGLGDVGGSTALTRLEQGIVSTEVHFQSVCAPF